MSSFITIRIEGLDQRISALNDIAGELETTKQQILEEVSSFMANEMRNNAHVISGNMRNSISSGVAGDTAIVSCTAEYAIYENARSGYKSGYGPHNFADLAEQATASRAPQIVNSAYDKLFSNY